MKMNMIETKRLTLRNWTASDAERLYHLAKDPTIGEAAGWPPHTSVEMSREVIRTVFSDENVLAIVLKSTGDVIGCIGLSFDANCPIAKDERILGYWLGVDYQGNGYTTEAAKALIKEAFAYGVAGIWCGNFSENRASARVQEKCGFRFRFDDADKNWGMADEGRVVTMRYLANDKQASPSGEGISNHNEHPQG